MNATATLLEVKQLDVQFNTDDGNIRAVDRVSFSIHKGETIGVLGESGCGKSVTALAIMRLIPCPPGRIAGGQILLKGEDLLLKSEAGMRDIRGNQVAMVFQEPMTSLNPVFTVGYQIIEAIRLHQKLNRKDARDQAVRMLTTVGIPSPEHRIDDFPHQLSGGMRQRVMIAMALSCNPELLIADEPTTALDVTIQAQILELMRQIRREFGMSIMLITHNLGVVGEYARRVFVMYAGRVVEQASSKELLTRPRHPYSLGLLESIPRVNQDVHRLRAIEGTVLKATAHFIGCRFHPRCSRKLEQCAIEEPRLEEIDADRKVRCWNPVP
jgi:oligopeptide/dipeptide ABC transporter ATP-binding protein